MNYVSPRNSNEWARVSTSERSRENVYYERYCFIQVSCNMNAKGQTWNENIWQWQGPKKKARVNNLVKWAVGGGTNIQSNQACVLRYKS